MLPMSGKGVGPGTSLYGLASDQSSMAVSITPWVFVTDVPTQRTLAGFGNFGKNLTAIIA